MCALLTNRSRAKEMPWPKTGADYVPLTFGFKLVQLKWMVISDCVCTQFAHYVTCKLEDNHLENLVLLPEQDEITLE